MDYAQKLRKWLLSSFSKNVIGKELYVSITIQYCIQGAALGMPTSIVVKKGEQSECRTLYILHWNSQNRPFNLFITSLRSFIFVQEIFNRVGIFSNILIN